MEDKCPEFNDLIAFAEGETQVDAAAHLESCPQCSTTVEELRGLGRVLRALAAAERAETPADLPAQLLSRVDRPSVLQKLPLALAGATRTALELTRPAVAPSLAAGLAGLVLGGWLAVASWNGPSDANAMQAYDSSSLVEEPADGLSDIYLQSVEADSTSEVGS